MHHQIWIPIFWILNAGVSQSISEFDHSQDASQPRIDTSNERSVLSPQIWSHLPSHLASEITYKRMVASDSLDEMIAFMESDPALIPKALQDQSMRLQIVKLLTRFCESNDRPEMFEKIINYPRLIDWKAEQHMEPQSGFALRPFDISKILLDQVFFSQQVISLILDKLVADHKMILSNPTADVQKLLSRALLRGCQSGASGSVISFLASPLVHTLNEGIIKNGAVEAASNDYAVIVQHFLESSPFFDDTFVGYLLERSAHPYSESAGTNVALYILRDPIQRPRLSASSIYKALEISIRTKNHALAQFMLNDVDLAQRMGLTIPKTDALVAAILETDPVEEKTLMAVVSNAHLLPVLSEKSLGRIFEQMAREGGSLVTHLFLFRPALVNQIPLGSLEEGSLRALETAEDPNQYLRALFYSQGRPLSRFSSHKLATLMDYFIESENTRWIMSLLDTPEWSHRISPADLGTIFLKAYHHLQIHPESSTFQPFLDTRILNRIPKEGRIVRIMQFLESHELSSTLSSISRMHIG